MIVTLSPAKLMNFDHKPAKMIQSEPLFADNANGLIDILQSFSVEDLRLLMKINPKQAFEVYQQVHSFYLDKTPSVSAAFAYNGIAYQGLDIKSFTQSELDYAQEHLIILSGLYGVLRPMDAIKPYRLEMQAKLENDRAANLYGYWTDQLTDYMTERLMADGDGIWVNLMSGEYTKAIIQKILPKDTQIIIPDFKEQTSTGYRQVVVHTKKARGLLARFILKNRLTDPEHIKAFDEEGYVFSNQLSKGKDWIFVR